MHNIWKKFLKYIEDEDIPGLLRFCLILLPFVGGAIWGMGALIRYITIHQEILVIIGIAACMIIPPFLKKKENKPEGKSLPVNDNMLFFERLLTKALFRIFTEYSQQFNVIAPLRYSDLKDLIPSGFDPGKKICVYRFKIMADGEPLSMADFHEYLTIHIEEQLASGELSLGRPTVEFNGRLYPKIFIDECSFAGGAWHIVLLVCDNENVSRYIDNKRQAIMMKHSRFTDQYDDPDFR